MERKLSKRQIFEKELKIPINGNSKTVFYSRESRLPLAKGYTRVVVGDRGAYIEFEKEHIIPENVRALNKFHIYFVEYQSLCEDKVLIYYQIMEVSYADYKIQKFYISPFLLGTDNIDVCAVQIKENKTLF